jgi:FHA domain
VKITSCIPLAGRGVIARHGGLVALTDASGPDPDPLLAALAEVAEAAGDGSELVLRATRAALASPGQPAWACAGITADGGVAVLVYGPAVATVRVTGGQDVTLTGSDSVIPVSRTFAGSAVAIDLATGDVARPDPRFWLGDGVVHGGGLALTVSADMAETGMMTPDAAPPARMPDSLPAVTMWPPVPPVPSVFETDAVGGSHPPTVDTTAAGVRPEDGAAGEPSQAVLVDGVLCARGHFNDPGARTCRQCGIGMEQPPRNYERRQRPPLGVLELDDGTRVTLDGDYVLGREPVLDGDVMAGRARPLRISDPDGTVSRLHLRVALVGWQVEVSDLGSANGSVLQTSGEELRLAPFEPAVIEPGTRIGIGHRSMRYLAYQGVRP